MDKPVNCPYCGKTAFFYLIGSGHGGVYETKCKNNKCNKFFTVFSAGNTAPCKDVNLFVNSNESAFR